MATVTIDDILSLIATAERERLASTAAFERRMAAIEAAAEAAAAAEAKRREEEAKRREEEAKRREEEAKRREEEAARREIEDQKLQKEVAKARAYAEEQIGKLGNRLGEFVEYMLKPDVVQLFQQRGIMIYNMSRDMKSQKPGLEMEIDMFLGNGNDCMLVEVKSKLSVDDVNEHLQRLEKFKLAFPAYHQHRLLGAVAAMVIPDEAAKYAYRRGLFVLGQKGDAMEILNDAKFQPKAW